MNKSAARRTLEAALKEAISVEQRAEIASRLAKVLDAEGRERARKRRAKAAKAATVTKAKKQDSAQLTEAELAQPFEHEPPRPAVICTPLRPDPLAAKRAQVEAEMAEAAKVAPVPEPPAAPPVTGWTRVIAAMSPPEVWDYDKGWVYDQNPQSSLGPNPYHDGFPPLCDAVESNAYSIADGFSYERRDPKTGEYFLTNEREERERREQEARDREWQRKLYGW
jgi:hypothetical protein